MKKLIWRLSSLPTPTELTLLVEKELITREEAREILINEKDVTEPKSDELKSEIEFLRKLVEKLSSNQTSKVIEYIQTYPSIRPWYQPYVTWCSPNNALYAAGNSINSAQCTNLDGLATQPQGSNSNGTGYGDTSFSSIQTF
jgi:hypothetical protein